MPKTAQEIRELINQKFTEISANKLINCHECGEQLSPPQTMCETCQRDFELKRLRWLAENDPAFIGPLAEVESEE